MDFEVRTPHNAHVSLTFGPKETDPMYEIILGGWENTQSVIRYKREKPDKVSIILNLKKKNVNRISFKKMKLKLGSSRHKQFNEHGRISKIYHRLARGPHNSNT